MLLGIARRFERRAHGAVHRLVVDHEGERVLVDPDHVADFERAGFDALAVDADAVGRAEVEHAVALAVAHEARVTARDARAAEHDLAARRATRHQLDAAARHDALDASCALDDQAGVQQRARRCYGRHRRGPGRRRDARRRGAHERGLGEPEVVAEREVEERGLPAQLRRSRGRQGRERLDHHAGGASRDRVRRGLPDQLVLAEGEPAVGVGKIERLRRRARRRREERRGPVFGRLDRIRHGHVVVDPVRFHGHRHPFLFLRQERARPGIGREVGLRRVPHVALAGERGLGVTLVALANPERVLADLDRGARRHQRAAAHGDAVDEAAVLAAEVLELEDVAHPPQHRMKAAHGHVVDDEVVLLHATDAKLGALERDLGDDAIPET